LKPSRSFSIKTLPPFMRQSTASSPGAAHAYLRAETRALHALAERHMGVSAAVDHDVYIQYLLFNRVCGPIEHGLVQAGVHRILPDWDQRERASALAEDLADLGVPPAAVQECPVGADAGTILGWSYVLEGSRLGAAVILRIVEASEEPRMRCATRFLRHGEGQGLWTSYKAALAGIDDDAGAIVRAGVAAKAAFGCFLGR
jgi:heme oxygenase (biliverdin-IX-beta and delta-forming)